MNALLDVPPIGITVRGVRVLHMGDVGNAIAPALLALLAGQVDVLLALTGAHATITPAATAAEILIDRRPPKPARQRAKSTPHFRELVEKTVNTR